MGWVVQLKQKVNSKYIAIDYKKVRGIVKDKYTNSVFNALRHPIQQAQNRCGRRVWVNPVAAGACGAYL